MYLGPRIKNNTIFYQTFKHEPILGTNRLEDKGTRSAKMQTYIRVLGLKPAALSIAPFIGPQKTSQLLTTASEESLVQDRDIFEVCVTLCLRLCCQL